MSAIDRYLANNTTYAASPPLANLPNTPTKRLAILACMDSRLEIAGMLGLTVGDAHVIRNAGGVVTDDVVRSLVISQTVLGTREIMIVQHTDCGMLVSDDSAIAEAIERVTGLRPSFALHSFSDLEGRMRQSIAQLVANPFIRYKDAIRGFIFDVKTGRLREVR